MSNSDGTENAAYVKNENISDFQPHIFEAKNEFHEIPISTKFPENVEKMDINFCENEDFQDGKPENLDRIIYRIDDVPPWHLSIWLGLQHYMTMVGGTLTIPFLLAPYLCVPEKDVANGQILSTILFVSGVVTILQTTFGVRLPIVQGGTFALLLPTIVILKNQGGKCDQEELSQMSKNETDEIWMGRMKEIQGAIIVSALFQILAGATGLVGIFLSFITPLTIVPTISLIGLSLFKEAADKASGEWGIAIMTIALLTIFSQYLAEFSFPFPAFDFQNKKLKIVKIEIFKFFPVILTILIAWMNCGILTAFDALPTNSTARTDRNLDLISNSPWIYFPYPFQWGIPTVAFSSVFGMLAGIIASMIESIGDYYACARLSEAPIPPDHAINRGVAMEGIGCVIAGIFGSGNGTTSYSENIGAIRITKIASRRVIQVGGIIMILCGIFGKFGAIFVTLPSPVIGGIFLVMFGVITAVGLSNLQLIDLNSSRNIYILGVSLFVGLSVPEWLNRHPDAISTGSDLVNHVLTVLLSLHMFVGGMIALFLDNTIPGTDEERGIHKWAEKGSSNSLDDDLNTTKNSTYDLPFGMNLVRKSKWCSKIPVCPTFVPWKIPKLKLRNVFKRS